MTTSLSKQEYLKRYLDPSPVAGGGNGERKKKKKKRSHSAATGGGLRIIDDDVDFGRIGGGQEELFGEEEDELLAPAADGRGPEARRGVLCRPLLRRGRHGIRAAPHASH